MSSKSQYLELAPLIHQAALDPHLSINELDTVCDASVHYGFSGLCTNLTRISAARARLGGSNKTKLVAVIAFPFGCIPSSHKQAEAMWAAEKGAEELDVVPNYLALKQGNAEVFAEELASICETGIPVRAILDIANLQQSELKLAIEASIDAGVHGIQTGNGFGRGVLNSDIQQLSNLTRGRCEIKAVGGIKTIDQAFELVEAGATKIGTSMGPQFIQSLLDIEKK